MWVVGGWMVGVAKLDGEVSWLLAGRCVGGGGWLGGWALRVSGQWVVRR